MSRLPLAGIRHRGRRRTPGGRAEAEADHARHGHAAETDIDQPVVGHNHRGLRVTIAIQPQSRAEQSPPHSSHIPRRHPYRGRHRRPTPVIASIFPVDEQDIP